MSRIAVLSKAPAPDRSTETEGQDGSFFEEALHVGRPNAGSFDDFLDRVRNIFERRWFTNNGIYVQEFEERLCDYLNVKHCIPVCNATLGLSIAAKALDLSGEVIVPAFTFVATPHSLLWQNIEPVFCDIDPSTHNLDVRRIEELITEKTTAVLGVHVWGRPCCIDELENLCRRRGLKLLFDAAHAFGCSHRERMIGNFGDAEVFSFHATKFFNTFEGGAIATNCDELARKVRLAINFGFAGLDTVTALGTNGKMNEISAAMGLTSLEALSHFVERNYENYRCYQRAFINLRGVLLKDYNEAEANNFQYIIAEVDEEEAGFSRDELAVFLRGQNVYVRRYFHPGCHMMEPYKSQARRRTDLSQTERLTTRVLSFPTGTSVEKWHIDRIASMILEFQRQREVQ